MKGRKRCRQEDTSIELVESSPRKKHKMVDTPRRKAIIRDCRILQGKKTQHQIFLAHKVSDSTGKRIIKSGEVRSTGNLSNRGRKRKLTEANLDTIEAYENANFELGTIAHDRIANALGFRDISERTVRRNMRERGVGWYTAAQTSRISDTNMAKRQKRIHEPEQTQHWYWY